jgi:hypothetical protein
MRRLRNQRARWLTSTLSHAPFASVNALMQQSTSPFQYGRLFPTAVGCRTGGGIAQRCRIDAPLTKHIQRPRRRYPRLTLNFGALEIPVFREVCPARPLSVWILKLQQSCREAFLWDAGSRRLPNLSRRANQVPLHLHRSTGSESSSQTMIAGVTCTLTSLHRALGSARSQFPVSGPYRRKARPHATRVSRQVDRSNAKGYATRRKQSLQRRSRQSQLWRRHVQVVRARCPSARIAVLRCTLK